MPNPEAWHSSVLANRKSPFSSAEEEQAGRQSALQAQVDAWCLYLPGLVAAFARIRDPRRPGSIKHKSVVLLTFGVLLFIFQYSSRREANRELTAPSFWELVREIFPEIDSIPHADTLARFLESIEPSELQSVLKDTVKRLLRNGRLKSFLVQHRYVVAIDGTQKFTSQKPFAPEALRRRHGQQAESYVVYVVEAVLVGPHGVTIPLMSEFLHNDGEMDPQAKQDCESKGFHRLARRLKQAFPRLPVMVVADGLYPNGPMMSLCRELSWDFMFVLKEGCLPSVWEEVQALRPLEPTQRLSSRWVDRDQQFWWVNMIEYEYQDADGRLRRIKIHVAGCTETWEESGEQKRSEWVWVSHAPLTDKNIVGRCNRMARRRWDVEEHILKEKCQGYHYEHVFSYNWNAIQGWHTLMCIGHLINTLTLLAVNLEGIVRRHGLQGTLRFLRTTWMGRWVDRTTLKRLCSRRPQLRLVI
jgi:hypothetical protein